LKAKLKAGTFLVRKCHPRCQGRYCRTPRSGSTPERSHPPSRCRLSPPGRTKHRTIVPPPRILLPPPLTPRGLVPYPRLRQVPRNSNFGKLGAGYLFPVVAKKRREFAAAHPDAKVPSPRSLSPTSPRSPAGFPLLNTRCHIISSYYIFWRPSRRHLS
jgi:hypothetical protein